MKLALISRRCTKLLVPAGLRRSAVLTIILLLCSYTRGTSLQLPPLSEQDTVLLSEAESAFRNFRYFDDQISVTRGRNAAASIRKVPLARLQSERTLWRDRLQTSLNKLATDRNGWSMDDRHAISVMRGVLADGDSNDSSGTAAVDCTYDPGSIAAQSGVEALEDRLYACFGQAAENIPFQGKNLDRLSVLGLIPRTDDPGMRRELFMALQNVWQTVNGGNTPSSPYRTLVRQSVQKWGPDSNPLDQIARKAGLDLRTLESWVVSALEKWREIGPQEAVEPWDFDYVTSRTTRDLSRKIRSRRRLEKLRDRYYGSLLGRVPAELGVHFDLTPRAGKDPVAFTTFGERNYLQGANWVQGEFWVLASYTTGNLDNLYELIHETGHSIHIAAIRTRPVFEDFPDSDAFTEALADMTGLEVYEPTWQRRFLGIEAPLAQSLQDKYSSMVLDLAWGLFEIRMYGAPASDPNQVWTEITRKYLNIKPHPELSWWANRGQLLNSPGYMLTYALSDFMSAALRARTKTLRGEAVFWSPRADLYGWLSEKLYRYGLERPAIRVLEDYLGGALRPELLLEDLMRAVPETRRKVASLNGETRSFAGGDHLPDCIPESACNVH